MIYSEKRFNIIIAIVIIYLSFILISSTSVLNSNEKRHQFKVDNINIGTLDTSNMKNTKIEIPHKVHGSEEFTLNLDISKYANKENYAISTYSNFANLEVFADDKLIYKKYTDPSHIVGSGGYYAVYFEIPPNLKSNILRFNYKPLLEKPNYTVIEHILIGKQGDLLLSMALSDSVLVITGIFLLLNFSAVFIFTLSKKDYFERENYGLLHLSVIGLNSAFYFCSQSWTLKYIFPNLNCFIHIVSFTSLAMLPIPILLFFKYQLDPKYKKLYDYLSIILIANVILQNILTISKVTEYISMLKYSHGLLFISVVLILYTFLRTDSKKFPSKEKFLIPIISTIIVVLIPLTSYIIYTTISFNKLSLVATFSFLILEISEFKYTYYNYQKEIKDKETFKRLATVDSLTGLSNRTNYNYFTKELSATEKSVKAWIIIMDLDNLKAINDKYGHIKGDSYIISFANLLKKEANKNPNINAFRMGGDEFFVFVKNEKNFNPNKWINTLKNKFSEINLISGDFEPSFSAGYYYFDSKVDNIKEIGRYYNIADKKMYDDKNRKKE